MTTSSQVLESTALVVLTSRAQVELYRRRRARAAMAQYMVNFTRTANDSVDFAEEAAPGNGQRQLPASGFRMSTTSVA